MLKIEPVAALIFLGIALVCPLVGRILLIGAAFGTSVWWALGVFLPFGPLFFRLSYPDLAPTSRYFRLTVLPCILACVYLQPDGFPARRCEAGRAFSNATLRSIRSNAETRDY